MAYGKHQLFRGNHPYIANTPTPTPTPNQPRPPPHSVHQRPVYMNAYPPYTVFAPSFGPSIPSHYPPQLAPPIPPSQPMQGGCPIYYHVHQPTTSMMHFPGQVKQGSCNSNWGCRKPGHSIVTPREHDRLQRPINRPLYQPRTEDVETNSIEIKTSQENETPRTTIQEQTGHSVDQIQ